MRQLPYRWFRSDNVGFVAVLLVLVTLIFSYPTIFHLSTHLPCSHPDAWQFVWNIFDFREQILHGKDPYFTDYMFYPLGTSLLLHNFTEFNDIVGLFFSPFFNDIAITNLMGMLATVLSGVGVYLLAMQLTGNSLAALFAAIAFAFTPFRMNRLTFQMHMALTQWMPFALLMFLRCANSVRVRYAFLTGLFFALSYYCNPYFAVYLLIAFFLMLLCGLLLFPGWRRITFLKHLLIAGIVAIVLMLPVAVRFYKDYREKTVYSYHYTHEASAKAERYLQRGFMNQYLNDLLGQSDLNKLVGHITRERRYSDITPGWIVLALGLAGIYCAFRYGHKELMLLSFVAISFFVLSLGPKITIGSSVFWMPFHWYTKIPYINHARIPERFAIMVTLMLSLAGAYSLALILPKLTGKKRMVMISILFAALLVELAPLPVPLKRFDPPDSFRSLSHMNGEVMLTIPYSLGPADSYYLAYQVVHHKKSLDGRIARIPGHLLAYFRSLPITRSLDVLSRTGDMNRRISKRDRKAATLFQRFFGIRYLAVHPPYSQRPDILRYVARVFPNAKLLFDQKGIKVYELEHLEDASYEVGRRDPGFRLFLLSKWQVDTSRKKMHILSRRGEAKLLLPDTTPDQNLNLELKIRFFSTKGKVRFVVANQIVHEIPIPSGATNVAFSIPSSLLQKARRIVSLQLAEANNPRFELYSLKAQIHRNT